MREEKPILAKAMNGQPAIGQNGEFSICDKIGKILFLGHSRLASCVTKDGLQAAAAGQDRVLQNFFDGVVRTRVTHMCSFFFGQFSQFLNDYFVTIAESSGTGAILRMVQTSQLE